jgi:FkbM family methyltransferase
MGNLFERVFGVVSASDHEAAIAALQNNIVESQAERDAALALSASDHEAAIAALQNNIVESQAERDAALALVGEENIDIAGLSSEFLNSYDLIARQEMDWIVRKMCFLDIVDSGSIDSGRFAYIKLKNGMTFFSFPTAEWQPKIFHERRDEFPLELKEEALNVAFDVVTRFIRENVGAHIPSLTSHMAMMGSDCQLIDVGAYIGYGAMRAARHSTKGGRILCIEAEGESCELLKMNIEENKLGDRISYFQAALGDADGEVVLQTELHEGNRQGNIMIEAMQDEVSGFDYDFDGYKPVTVPLKKMDTLLNESGWIDVKKPHLTHLGINGAELKALRGMSETLKESPSFAVKVSTRYFDPAEGPIHDQVVRLFASLDDTKVVDVKPHVYAYRWANS